MSQSSASPFQADSVGSLEMDTWDTTKGFRKWSGWHARIAGGWTGWVTEQRNPSWGHALILRAGSPLCTIPHPLPCYPGLGPPKPHEEIPATKAVRGPVTYLMESHQPQSLRNCGECLPGGRVTAWEPDTQESQLRSCREKCYSQRYLGRWAWFVISPIRFTKSGLKRESQRMFWTELLV